MYFPKSQITTDLYTNGTDYVIAGTEIDYTGYYFKTSEGRFYTGKNPNDPPIQELEIRVVNPTEDPEEGDAGAYGKDTALYLIPDAYGKAAGISPQAIPPNPPKQTVNIPTEQNYSLGEFQRYFASKDNEIDYIEIDLDQYKKFVNEESDVDYNLYSVFSLPWLITGNRNEVINVNKKTVERVSKNLNLVGFLSYFSNRLDQYFRYQVGENLKTDGTEFIVESTRKRYSGLYHIHPNKGPMVGAQHVPFSHEFLIPISGSNQQNRINKVETQTSNNRGSTGYSGGY
tara:strand:- start:2729 stop:3586 length:858 start_codon:yes stop_codon:yes gene_type:complete